MSVITIIGAGMMGTAMCRPATDNGHTVRLVGTPLDRDSIASVQNGGPHLTLRKQLPEGLAAYQIEDLDAALRGADLVICGVSSFGVDWFTETILPKLAAGTRVLAITKGLWLSAKRTLSTFPDYWTSLRPDVEFMAVGGPCISYGLFNRRHTLVSFCGHNMDNVVATRALFATPYYHIVPTTDVIGLEGSVALKNAYALCVSLAVGLGEKEVGALGPTLAEDEADLPKTPDLNPGFNPQAALFGQSCQEMRQLVALLGGNPDFVAGPAGAGDLYVTVFGGRTRRLGTLLGRGMPYAKAREVLAGVTLESVSIVTRMAAGLRQLAADGKADLSRFPLLTHIDAVINQGAPLALEWERFGHA